MLALMGLIRKLARPLALWRQQLGADLSLGWGDVVRHLQGFPQEAATFSGLFASRCCLFI